MRVIIFGATGKTGLHTARQALRAGHHVTAFGRSVDKLDPEPGLDTHHGDALDPDAVTDAVAGHEAVIICLGGTNLRDRTTLTTSTTNVVNAASDHEVPRLVAISAADVGDSWTQIPWSSRLMFKTMLRNVFADHQAQEAVIGASALDWTIVRAAVLTDKPATGNVEATNTGKTTRISRADLADFLVSQITADTYNRRTVSVTA